MNTIPDGVTAAEWAAMEKDLDNYLAAEGLSPIRARQRPLPKYPDSVLSQNSDKDASEILIFDEKNASEIMAWMSKNLATTQEVERELNISEAVK